MKTSRLDHLVLTVAGLNKTCDIYSRVLGMETISFLSGGIQRRALFFGNQKINLYLVGAEFGLKATNPKPGSADLCLIVDQSMDQVITMLQANDVAVEEGPVQHTGATGLIQSVYFRDPDGNLIEASDYST